MPAAISDANEKTELAFGDNHSDSLQDALSRNIEKPLLLATFLTEGLYDADRTHDLLHD